MEQHGGFEVICHQKAKVFRGFKLCDAIFTVIYYIIFWLILKSQVKFIFKSHFMYKTIKRALHEIKALQRGVEIA